MKLKSTLCKLAVGGLLLALATGCSVDAKSKKKNGPNGGGPGGGGAAAGKLVSGLDGQWSSQCFNSVLGNEIRSLDVAGKQMMLRIDKFQDENCTIPSANSEEPLEGTYEVTADLTGGGSVVKMLIPIDGNISAIREFSIAKTDYGFSMSLFYNTAFDDPRPMILEMRPVRSGEEVEPTPEPTEPALVLIDGQYDRLEKVEKGCDHTIAADYDGGELQSILITKDTGCSPKFVSLECRDNVCRSANGDYLEVMSEKSYYFRAYYGFPSNYELK